MYMRTTTQLNFTLIKKFLTIPSGACWLNNTHLMNFWTQLLLTADKWLAIGCHFWSSINFSKHLIKLGHFMYAAGSEKTMLVHLVDVPWLVGLSMLQNMLECCRLFGKCSSLHLIWLSCIHYHLVISLQLYFYLLFCYISLPMRLFAA